MFAGSAAEIDGDTYENALERVRAERLAVTTTVKPTISTPPGMVHATMLLEYHLVASHADPPTLAELVISKSTNRFPDNVI
eukprot:1918969-Rhodomonas_salina.2